MMNQETPVEIFGIPSLDTTGNNDLVGILFKNGEKTFLIDRRDSIRGIYDALKPEDDKRLMRDIQSLQQETRRQGYMPLPMETGTMGRMGLGA